MRQPHGFAIIVDPDQRDPLLERDTVTCGHCQALVFVKPGTGATTYLIPQLDRTWKEEPGAFCRVCMSAICITCCDKGNCTPFEKQLEVVEAREKFLRSAGIYDKQGESNMARYKAVLSDGRELLVNTDEGEQGVHKHVAALEAERVLAAAKANITGIVPAEITELVREK